MLGLGNGTSSALGRRRDAGGLSAGLRVDRREGERGDDIVGISLNSCVYKRLLLRRPIGSHRLHRPLYLRLRAMMFYGQGGKWEAGNEKDRESVEYLKWF